MTAAADTLDAKDEEIARWKGMYMRDTVMLTDKIDAKDARIEQLCRQLQAVRLAVLEVV